MQLLADFHDDSACVAATKVDVEEDDGVARVASSRMSARHAWRAVESDGRRQQRHQRAVESTTRQSGSGRSPPCRQLGEGSSDASRSTTSECNKRQGRQYGGRCASCQQRQQVQCTESHGRRLHRSTSELMRFGACTDEVTDALESRGSKTRQRSVDTPARTPGTVWPLMAGCCSGCGLPNKTYHARSPALRHLLHTPIVSTYTSSSAHTQCGRCLCSLAPSPPSLLDSASLTRPRIRSPYQPHTK